jgi:sugar/nucleoside kinase (ribokinase family)
VESRAGVDYTTVGHVAIDVMADGSRRPGGSAFYSALQAARLGQRARIITRGSPGEIERVIEPYGREVEVEVSAAAQTTTLQSSGSGARRTQRILAWAGPIGGQVAVDTSILHFAPIARETPNRWTGRADFVGLTPQGLVRQWASGSGHVSLVALARGSAPPGCHAVVLSERERASCEVLIAQAAAAGAIVAVTAGPAPTQILLPDGGVLEVEVPALEDPADDLGAGDVFAAAFFLALSEGRGPRVAAAFANAAAAVRMGGTGPEAIGQRTAIERRMRAVA